MPRNNRKRQQPQHEPLNVSRLTAGFRRTEVKGGRTYTVQSISGESAKKDYTCPGCSIIIEAGTPHVVAWREDGLFGEDADLSERRHWHTHCWKIAT